MRQVFFNRHDELRAGWRIGLFIVLAGLLMYLAVLPLQFILPLMDEMGMGLIGQILPPLLALAGALMGTWILTRYLNRKPFAAVGLWFHARTLPEFGWGCLLGFLGMALVYVVLRFAGGVEMTMKDLAPFTVLGIVLASLLSFAAAALLEEVLFRGYPFQTMIQGLTLLPAVIIMAILFAAAHYANPNASFFGIVNIGLAAVLLSVAYVKTKGLWLPFGIHLGWNFSQTTVFGFRTSGIEFDQLRIVIASVNAPDWLSGGTFGPEGGALATISLVVLTVVVLKSRRFEAPLGIITLDTIEDLAVPGSISAEENG